MMCIRREGIRVVCVRPSDVRDIVAIRTDSCIRLDSLSYPDFWIEICTETLHTKGRFSDQWLGSNVNNRPSSTWRVRDREIEVSSTRSGVQIIVILG